MRKRQYFLPAIFLIILFAIPFWTNSAHGQWYTSRFGIAEIGAITEDQAPIAIQILERRAVQGKRMAIAGIVAAATPFVLLKMNKSWGIFSGLDNADSYLLGTALVLLVPAGLLGYIIGAARWKSASKQKMEIESAFVKTISQMALTPLIGWHHQKYIFGAQVSVSLNPVR